MNWTWWELRRWQKSLKWMVLELWGSHWVPFNFPDIVNKALLHAEASTSCLSNWTLAFLSNSSNLSMRCFSASFNFCFKYSTQSVTHMFKTIYQKQQKNTRPRIAECPSWKRQWYHVCSCVDSKPAHFFSGLICYFYKTESILGVWMNPVVLRPEIAFSFWFWIHLLSLIFQTRGENRKPFIRSDKITSTL